MSIRCAFSWSVPVILGVLALATPALAQAYNEPQIQQVAAPNYGGGFLQLLLTGHSAAYNQPDAAYRAEAEGVEPQRIRNPIYRRQEVAYSGPGKPGEIVIDTQHKFLYLVQKGGKALRYGVGVGREGFAWTGVERITRKAEWPAWTPPSDMLKRRPDLPIHMAGGIGNPLGARALYLGNSLYRIHGTNEPDTIGTSVSSGCIRMMNQDVIDLYNRVKIGTKVTVM